MIFSAHAERAAVTVEDVERLSGFAEHKKRNADFDREREAGLRDDTRDKAAEERALQLAGKAEQKRVKPVSPGDNKILYQQDQNERRIFEKEQAAIRAEFVRESRGLSKHPLARSISEEEELDLINKRPRFDYKKRTLYSSRGSIVPTAPSSGRRMKDNSRPTNNNSNPTFPAPPSGPSYDEFPPPPPPPMYGNDSGGQDEFPPPPPAFDEFDSDFPPPPPPPPMDFPPPEN